MRFTIGEDDNVKKEIQRTARFDEATDNFVRVICADLDCSFSELARAALIIASPQIKACRRLLRVSVEEDSTFNI